MLTKSLIITTIIGGGFEIITTINGGGFEIITTIIGGGPELLVRYNFNGANRMHAVGSTPTASF